MRAVDRHARSRRSKTAVLLFDDLSSRLLRTYTTRYGATPESFSTNKECLGRAAPYIESALCGFGSRRSMNRLRSPTNPIAAYFYSYVHRRKTWNSGSLVPASATYRSSDRGHGRSTVGS